MRRSVEWVATLAVAIATVLAVKAYVVNPYRVPSASMEPTLHCAKPGGGCEARFDERILANRLAYRRRDPKRGEIVVFRTPPETARRCGAGGTFVKRLIGLPGEVVSERGGIVYVNGKPLAEPYIPRGRRDTLTESWPRIPLRGYFMMGDNRMSSCDSRKWGTVPRENLIGPVMASYWPPSRIALR